ncbi:MAG: hypothetical protein SFX74_01505 [Fimbriimonadaceae bacterium]|nr:hypothetical protein [Fimbriimonadaceae bacterium]
MPNLSETLSDLPPVARKILVPLGTAGIFAVVTQVAWIVLVSHLWKSLFNLGQILAMFLLLGIPGLIASFTHLRQGSVILTCVLGALYALFIGVLEVQAYQLGMLETIDGPYIFRKVSLVGSLVLTVALYFYTLIRLEPASAERRDPLVNASALK